MAPLFPKYAPNSPPTIPPIIGIGINSYPIMAPDTAEPSDVPVDITIRDTGAIFLYGILFYWWFYKAF